MATTSSFSRTHLRGSRLMVPQTTPCLATNTSIKSRRRLHGNTRLTIPRALRSSPSLAFKGLSLRLCLTGSSSSSSSHRNTRRSTARSRPRRPPTHRKPTTPPPMPVRPRPSGNLHTMAMGLQTLATEALLRDLTPRRRTDTLPARRLRRLSSNRLMRRPFTVAIPSLLRVPRYPASAHRHRQPPTIQPSLWGRSSRMEGPLDSSIPKRRTLRRLTCRSARTETTVIPCIIGTRDPIRRRHLWHHPQCSRSSLRACTGILRTHHYRDVQLSSSRDTTMARMAIIKIKLA